MVINIIPRTGWFPFLPLFIYFFLNRPQRAKMRFWAKGKQGEKKTTRVKPATRLEVLPLLAGSDMIPVHQFSDGKNRQRMAIVFIISVYSFWKFAIFLIIVMAILLAIFPEIGPGLWKITIKIHCTYNRSSRKCGTKWWSNNYFKNGWIFG